MKTISYNANLRLPDSVADRCDCCQGDQKAKNLWNTKYYDIVIIKFTIALHQWFCT